MDLTEHFTYEELTATQHRWIDNDCPDNLLPNLKRLALLLEIVRDLLKVPIHISSGYRCPELNAAIGGSTTSRHMLALAADFVAPRYGSVSKVCQVIQKSGIEFDQLIFEFGRWVHVGLSPSDEKPRRQVLSIVDHRTGYFPGLPEEKGSG